MEKLDILTIMEYIEEYFYIDGIKRGKARYFYINGDIEKYTYVNGKKEGAAEYITTNGKKIKYTYKNDKRINLKKENHNLIMRENLPKFKEESSLKKI